MEYSTIVFPRSAAVDPNSAMDQIFDVFHDHYPKLIDEDNKCWIFALEWPVDYRWYVDPNTISVAQKMYGLSIEDISSFIQTRKIGKIDFILSMIHSRAISIIPKTLSRLEGETFSHIIHVDDHTDMMQTILSPLGESNRLLDSIFSNEVDLLDEKSTNYALNRGVIHKGNFLTSYIISHDKGSVIHVKKDSTPYTANISINSNHITFAGESYKGTKLSFSSEGSNWIFKQMISIPTDLSDEYVGPIWLDIDMDEFCNRYDGDSSNQNIKPTDYEYICMRDKIDSFLTDLSNANWLSKIEAISVAISPGFFPADYWEYAIPRVCDGIEHIMSNI